jgi:nitrogen regulatory protein P-II 1
MIVKKVEVIVEPFELDELKRRIDIAGITTNAVAGFARQDTKEFVPKVKLEILVPEGRVAAVVDRIEAAVRSGACADGRVFVATPDASSAAGGDPGRRAW